MIKFKFAALILSFLFLNLAEAQQSNCIELEGIKIGCVPSQSHVCFRNVNVELSGGQGECRYTTNETASYHFEAPEGSIAWECAAWETEKLPCEIIGDKEVCPENKTCKEYSTPVCTEKCVSCYPKLKTTQKSTVGCIVCTRPRCSQEPTPGAYCPLYLPSDPTYFIPERRLPLCGAKDPQCPKTRTDPLGVVHNVQITQNCPEPFEPKLGQATPKPPSCPWINDPSPAIPAENPTSAQINAACDEVFPIKEPNRFPEDWTPPQ